jgi:HEAT repeat protein
VTPKADPQVSQSRFLAVGSRFVMPARRALQLLLGRLPPPAQRLGASALRVAAARWPALSRLLGVTPSSPAGPGHDTLPVEPTSAAPSPAPSPSTSSASSPAKVAGREEQLARLREASDYAERARAALALARITDAEATAALIAALRDTSSEVAAQAAEALAHHRGDLATSALRGVLENRDGYFNAVTRASAVRALGTLLPVDQGTPIAAAVRDVDAIVSLAAIAALAERDESTSAGALMGVLEDRAGYYLPLTRQAAARALLRLRHYDRDRLRGLLASEYDATVREALSSLAN